MQNKYYIDLVPKRPQKVTRAVATPIIKSTILFTQRSKYNENAKVSSSQNMVVPFVEGNSCRQGTKNDEKLLDWHTLMLQTFDKFLLQLDELFMNLRTEKRFKNLHCLPILNSYKDICEKLRLEILIAIDKLELTNAKANKKERDVEFLDKMSVLKTQLSQIRWQYHQAIQCLNVSNK